MRGLRRPGFAPWVLWSAALAATLWLAEVAHPVRAAASVPPGVQSYFFLVFSDPAPGTEAEYNRWYDNEHGPDVTSIPGFVSARRYVYAEQQLREVALKKPKYLILYRIVTDDPAAVRREIERRAGNGMTRQSPTLTNVKMYTYRAFRPEVMGAGGDASDARPGPKQTYLQVVFGDAVQGMDQAFNDWYDQVHEPDMLKVPGFVKAQRGILSEFQMAPTDEGPSQSRYLALFEIQTSDLAAVLRGNKGGAEPIAAFDRTRTFGYTYRAIGPVMVGDDIRAERSKSR
ncbi:MAG TPA: hypothetical protein VMI92_03940 [Steroidobacteraceae bacterium]|nr:hypothetical protein [Steroidobacteraceae bacterium]